MKFKQPALCALLILGLAPIRLGAESFYSKPALFSKRPEEGRSSQTVDRFGPVGMSIELIQPAFVMRIKAIEEGSPAAGMEGLAPGMIIESINGETLRDIDPRIQLGNLITAAEASDGRIRLRVKDAPDGAVREVVVNIPVLGAFSPTWPIDCPKSDRIVRNFADYLKSEGAQRGFAGIGMLFLLSTGDEGDLAYVREWARGQDRISSMPWHLGYGGLAMCEYYLRTGDQDVLPNIQERVDRLVEMENNGGWGAREAITHLTYGGGGGHLNAAGVLCAAYLLLAKECGADVSEETLLRTLAHFYRFAGRGNVPYGNNKPEGGFTDNGKNGKNAFVMAAAAALAMDGERSIYARARDTAAQFAFYSTGYMLHGHTGGGIGEIWRSASMGLLHETMPGQYRDFMDQRRWHYELSRRFDGSFGILGGERYDTTEWGAGYALTFTVPRKTLRLTGAPPTRHSQRFQLPERPWGTAEDDDFVSIEPAARPDGTRPDLSDETIADSTGFALISNRGNTNRDADALLDWLLHPNYTVRTIYLGEIRNHPREFLDALLAHDDARVRRTALEFLESNNAGPHPLEPGRLETIRTMLADPDESWFVKEIALRVLTKAPKEWVIGQLDLLLPFFEHEEWWLRQSTLVALTPVVAEEDAYRRVIPAIGQLIRSNHIFNITGPVRWGAMPENIRKAGPEVQELARSEFREAYANFVGIDHPLELVRNQVNPTMREFLAETITNVPGGYDVLFEVSRERAPDAPLPYAELFLKADMESFSPGLRDEVRELIKTELIPRYIGENRDYLLKEQANEYVQRGFYYTEPRVLGLAELYRRVGIHDYDWKDFGPAPTEMRWHYHSFDPPEELALDSGRHRYREVTFPQGMEEWNAPAFDPGRAGWPTGLAPFGATNGELITREGNCPLDFCRHGVPMQTLWEKEVLLLRGRFRFPELREGHRYQLLIGGMSHVGAGEGYRVYINGELFQERTRNIDRREGARPIGREIDSEWWPHFQGRETDIAFISFMGGTPTWRNRHLMVWVQEMKFPPIGPEEILRSVLVTPMTSASWQALQDPDANDLDPEQGKFLWDGTFVANPALTGARATVGYVDSLEGFNPERPRDANRAPLAGLDLKPDGATDDPLWIWSGNVLMNLRRNEALEMRLETLDGTEYLFIEVGGFESRRGMEWKAPWMVMKRP